LIGAKEAENPRMILSNMDERPLIKPK